MDELEEIRMRKLEELKRGIGIEEKNKPLKATDANIDEMLEKNRLLLVDFWAEWCGPCRMIAPVIEGIAKEYAGRLAVAKLNVDENPQTAMRFQTMSIPTIILFKEGKLAERIVGAAPKGMIEARLLGHLK
jgi:thioredoxin 1